MPAGPGAAAGCPGSQESSGNLAAVRRMTCGRTAVAGALALLATATEAHAFVQPYTLPVPFWLYLFACAATVVLTFAVVGYFVSVPAVAAAAPRIPPRSGSGRRATLPAWALRGLRALAVGCLLLSVVAGLIGTRDPDANINVTLFWVVFVLVFTYATALVGDVFALINPWRTIVEWFETASPGPKRTPLVYPARLGYWPALISYIGLIWLELFTLPSPRGLSMVLVVYSLVTFAGAWLFGKAAWFRYGELFGVLLRFVGLLAPVEYQRSAATHCFEVRMRWPLSGVLAERPEKSLSLVLFVLFMLSSTTFDGMHETIVWMSLFWKHLVVVFQPLWGTDLIASQRMLEHWYVAYQRAGLVLSPFLYLAFYFAVILALKAVTRTTIPLRDLAGEFAFTVLPIAIVYNMAHYWTLLLTRIQKLPYLVSDPFGFHWHLLGLTPPAEFPPPNMGAVWNTEVALILVGHLAAVYLAHRIALRVFPSRRDAILSQVPMLLLMVSYTVMGLWVISQALALE